MKGALGELPPDGGLLPAIVIDAREHRSRGRIVSALMGDEHHGTRLGIVVGENVKERTGLEVAILDVLEHLIVALGYPLVDGLARFKFEFGMPPARGDHLE